MDIYSAWIYPKGTILYGTLELTISLRAVCLYGSWDMMIPVCTAQGGGGSFKDKKTIAEVRWCE